MISSTRTYLAELHPRVTVIHLDSAVTDRTVGPDVWCPDSTVPFHSIRPSPVPSLVDVDLIGRLSPVPGSNGLNFINFFDDQTSPVLTMAGFGQILSLVDDIFSSSNLSLVSPQ
jgi:hypothetical protein